MRLTFSTDGTARPTPSSRSDAPYEDVFTMLDSHRVREVHANGFSREVVYLDLNTEQAQALVEQLHRDYPYLFDHSKKVEA